MNTTETLTSLLHARADQKLEKEVAQKLPGDYEFGQRVLIPGNIAKQLRDNLNYHAPKVDGEDQVVFVPYLLEALRAAGIRHLQDAARKKEVREFLDKVEAAAAAIDELQSEGGNQ